MIVPILIMVFLMITCDVKTEVQANKIPEYVQKYVREGVPVSKRTCFSPTSGIPIPIDCDQQIIEQIKQEMTAEKKSDPNRVAP